MPFTFAHPVAVFPFFKKSYGLSATALVIGSMVPDFEYFFRLREYGIIGHRLVGILPFDLPLTLLLCFVFHSLIKKPLIEYFPKFIKNRTGNAYHFNFSTSFNARPLMVVLSALIGILTHLFLDAFTHHDGFFVEHFSYFAQTLMLGNKAIKMHFMLQLILSVIGCTGVAYYLFNIKAIAQSIPNSSSYFFLGIFIFFYLLIFISRILLLPQYNTFWGVVMAIFGSTVYALFFAGLFEKIRTLRRNQQSSI